MLSETHPSYDKEKCSETESLNLAQMEKVHWKESDKKPSRFDKKFKKNEASGEGKFGEDSSKFKEAASLAQKWQKKYKNPDEMPDSVIPDSWDFRNIGGYDFTGDLRD